MARGFIYESLVKPEAYVRLDFNSEEPVDYSAQMPAINKPPIGLSEQELLTVIAFMQSNGGKVTVTPEELTLDPGDSDPMLEAHNILK